MTTKPPVALTASADFGGKVSVELLSRRSITMAARGVGEIAGPAIELQIQIDNASAAPIDLGSVNVSVADAAGIPSVSMSGSPSQPFSGQLAALSKAKAVYVFALSTSHKNPITITVGYSAKAPVVAFTGSFG